MAELAGFPELSILALFYYRGGGIPVFLHEECDCDDGIRPPFSQFQLKNIYSDCGCGIAGCGQPAGIAPLDPRQLGSIFRAHTSADDVDGAEGGTIKALLRFWEDNFDDNNGNQLQPQASGMIRDVRNINITENQRRSLPPLIQILLLKLLYTSPVSVIQSKQKQQSFLDMSSDAISYLVAKFKQSTRLDYSSLASGKVHKSHWAYFVLIRAVVVGERMKPHRRAIFPYHIPVGDIIAGKDCRFADESFQAIPKRTDQSLQNDENDNDFFPREASLQFLQQTMMDLLANNPYPRISTTVKTACSNNRWNPPLYVIGDSHILSIAWQTIQIRSSNSNDSNQQHQHCYRTATPLLITGLKAWHCRSETNFFTHTNVHSILKRISSGGTKKQTIIFSAGEIDCREGIGGKVLEGYSTVGGGSGDLLAEHIKDSVLHTVKVYVDALANFAELYHLQILVMPVAPHGKNLFPSLTFIILYLCCIIIHSLHKRHM